MKNLIVIIVIIVVLTWLKPYFASAPPADSINKCIHPAIEFPANEDSKKQLNWGENNYKMCKYALILNDKKLDLSKNDNSKYSKLKAHINYIANCNSTEEFSKMSRMVTMLLQDEIILKEFQDWYTTSLDSIDTSNDEGKKLRLAFLLSEALFALLSFKYIKLSDKEQKEIFEDLKNFLL